MANVVELSAAEWQQVLAILSMAPWRDANPLMMKIGEQLKRQMMPASGDGARPHAASN